MHFFLFRAIFVVGQTLVNINQFVERKKNYSMPLYWTDAAKWYFSWFRCGFSLFFLMRFHYIFLKLQSSIDFEQIIAHSPLIFWNHKDWFSIYRKTIHFAWFQEHQKRSQHNVFWMDSKSAEIVKREIDFIWKEIVKLAILSLQWYWSFKVYAKKLTAFKRFHVYSYGNWRSNEFHEMKNVHFALSSVQCTQCICTAFKRFIVFLFHYHPFNIIDL